MDKIAQNSNARNSYNTLAIKAEVFQIVWVSV